MSVDVVSNSLPPPPPAIARELDAFADQFGRFNCGELTAEQFRQYRLGFGVYGQKQPGVHMVRVKLPAGLLRAEQMVSLAGLSERFASGVSHLTTRQDVQFHFVPAQKLVDLLRALAAAGFTTREACGSTVRNVTACPDAGALGSEKFDVRPYAWAVSNYFLRNPFAQQLARKFKLALSACPEDCTLSAIHDAGLTAAVRDVEGRRQIGFRLTVGGGLGATPFAARLLDPFVPADELLITLRALLKVYAAHGNRRQRARARIKFLVHRLGIEVFRDLVETERRNLTELEIAEARLEEHIPDEFLPQHALYASGRIPAATAPWIAQTPAAHGDAEFRPWHAHNIRPHRDPALALITILTPLGDLRAEVFRSVASITREFCRGEARISIGQNLVLPAVDRTGLPELHRALAALGLAGAGAGTALDITACAGADTCGLGITSSKGVAVALREALLPLAAGPGLESLRGLTIKVSGCPNACGQHSIADIGLHGVVVKENGRQIPAYQFHLGGSASGPSGAELARPFAKIPARRAPAALAALAARFQRDRIAHESFHDFFARVGEIPLAATLAPFANPLAAGDDAALDWGQLLPFATQRAAQPLSAAPGDADPFLEIRATLHQTAEFMSFGQREDALANLQRARYAITRLLLARLGKQPESDYETNCEIRALLVDRGFLSENWNELHLALEAAMRQRHPPSSLIAALQAKLELFLAEAGELLPALGKTESLDIPA
jgi:sulfite reductase beta subunit-like hemoprotein